PADHGTQLISQVGVVARLPRPGHALAPGAVLAEQDHAVPAAARLGPGTGPVNRGTRPVGPGTRLPSRGTRPVGRGTGPVGQEATVPRGGQVPSALCRYRILPAAVWYAGSSVPPVPRAVPSR